jgi:hypothetical protein
MSFSEAMLENVMRCPLLSNNRDMNTNFLLVYSPFEYTSKLTTLVTSLRLEENGVIVR